MKSFCHILTVLFTDMIPTGSIGSADGTPVGDTRLLVKCGAERRASNKLEQQSAKCRVLGDCLVVLLKSPLKFPSVRQSTTAHSCPSKLTVSLRQDSTRLVRACLGSLVCTGRVRIRFDSIVSNSDARGGTFTVSDRKAGRNCGCPR